MLSYFSEEWCQEFGALLGGLPRQVGLSGIVRFSISKTPYGKVQFCLIVSDGQIDLVPGKDGDEHATVVWNYLDAVAWCKGELDRDVAFMTGRCKVEGDYATYVFILQPIFGGEHFTALLAELAARSTSSVI